MAEVGWVGWVAGWLGGWWLVCGGWVGGVAVVAGGVIVFGFDRDAKMKGPPHEHLRFRGATETVK